MVHWTEYRQVAARPRFSNYSIPEQVPPGSHVVLLFYAVADGVLKLCEEDEHEYYQVPVLCQSELINVAMTHSRMSRRLMYQALINRTI